MRFSAVYTFRLCFFRLLALFGMVLPSTLDAPCVFVTVPLCVPVAPSDETGVLAFVMHHICAEYGLQTSLATTQEFRVLALNLQLISVEYVFDS